MLFLIKHIDADHIAGQHVIGKLDALEFKPARCVLLLASVVLPKPGKSSNSTCPPASRLHKASVACQFYQG